MSHVSPDRPNDPPIPPYRWVASKPDPARHDSTGGCYGCAFRNMLAIRCSRIPCHVGKNRGMVAQIIPA